MYNTLDKMIKYILHLLFAVPITTLGVYLYEDCDLSLWECYKSMVEALNQMYKDGEL